ncbi:TIP41-like protein [Golovinomyces cichoracearum]|uniref:TIP41-like protein n=1 Tax=Golovinomyces cichoracearum TaxID=62708 RepID=A0A420INW8_9PEZI|nr:TIP41-like protein [Golovinomyces cichoracearum]
MAFANSISEAYPDPDVAEEFTATYIHNDFKISARKLPISKSSSINQMSEKLDIPVPEMIFGDNFISIEHIASGWHLKFTAFDALSRVDKTDKKMLKVAYSQEWSKNRSKESCDGIKEIVKPFDWSYTTDYQGTLVSGKLFELQQNELEPIPIELLKRPDPILFFEEVVLYESELDDNGISLLNCKVRVMPDRMLLLCRFFMRLDNVIIRIRDTRIYIDFSTGKVLRDYIEKEGKFEDVRQSFIRTGMPHTDVIIAMRDSNQVAPFLTETTHTLESLILP